MEKGGGKLIPFRTVEQRRKGSTDINGWLPTVDILKRGSKYSAKAKVHHPVQRYDEGTERSIFRDQQHLIPAEKSHSRGHTGYHSYSGSKHFPNYSFRNPGIISATSETLSQIRPQTRPRSCMHCAHSLNNGVPKFSSIHSTLAYAKCRCHRPDTTNRLQSRGSSREAQCESTGGKLFKTVQFPQVANDNSQTVLLSLARNPGCLSEQPSMESEVTSTSKLPTLKSGSMVSAGSSSQQLGSSSQHRLTGSGLMRRSSIKLLHSSTAKLTPIAEANSTIQLGAKKKHEDNFKLTDLWKLVSNEKREHLIKLFKKLDTDDDGHISWKELSSYFCEKDDALRHYLHELYKLTSEATYFGKPEFVVCHSVHELLHCKKLPSSQYLSVDRYYLNNFILPFLIKMSKMAHNGQLNIQHLERNTLHTSSSSQLVFARAKQWTNSNEVSLLQLLSYAPVILSPV